MKFSTAITRALRLKCPQCGEADIADGWLSTQPSCSACGADLAVETGYFLGAIYFNYGATVLITLSAAIPLIFVAKLPTMPVVGAAMIFCVAFSTLVLPLRAKPLAGDRPLLSRATARLGRHHVRPTPRNARSAVQ